MRRSVSLDMLQPNFTASRMTTRSAYGSCREALRIANACSVTLRTVYFWSEPENRHGGTASTRTSPMVCPRSLPGRGTRERLLHRADLRPWIGAKMSQARRKVVDSEVAGSDRRRQLAPVQWRGDRGAGPGAGRVSCDCGRAPPVAQVVDVDLPSARALRDGGRVPARGVVRHR